MRFPSSLMLLLAFGIGAARAQVGAETTTATPAAPTVAAVSVTPTVTAVTPQVCLAPSAFLPVPCPAVVTRTVTGDPTLLVLGTEEALVYRQFPVTHLGWRDAQMNYDSYFAPGNPLTYSRVNRVVTRHGNPYYPYYQVSPFVRVAGLTERFSATPSTLSAQDRATLQAVAARYHGLTPNQAMAFGYTPVGAPMPDLGQVYLNQALITNGFDAMMPEAFVFDQRGELVAMQYYLIAAQPMMIFGQPTQASSLVPGAQQLTVRLL